MHDDPGKTPFERIVDLLVAHGVRFIVVGGQAAILHGSPVPTFDTDLCYERSGANLEKLAAALEKLNIRLRGAPPDLPFRIDARGLALGSNFTFIADGEDLDLLGYLEPIGGYGELMRSADQRLVGDHNVDVIGLDDLIRIKEHVNRPKDQIAAIQLRAIRDERRER